MAPEPAPAPPPPVPVAGEAGLGVVAAPDAPMLLLVLGAAALRFCVVVVSVVELVERVVD
ncbi:MAG TPA: hypothetical protein VN649_08870 [Ramlibacter sp.]|nr:hypothetical protein [Ramlibacter sp.]